MRLGDRAHAHIIGLTCGMSGPCACHRAVLGELCLGAARMESCRASSVAPPVRYAPLPGDRRLGSNRKPICRARHSPPQADRHEKSTPEGVLRRNAEPPPVDRTEGGRCAPEGTRTPNLLNRNQMLYPLSYGRLPFGWIQAYTLFAGMQNQELCPEPHRRTASCSRP